MSPQPGVADPSCKLGFGVQLWCAPVLQITMLGAEICVHQEVRSAGAEPWGRKKGVIPVF